MAETYGWLRQLLADQGIELPRTGLADSRPIREHSLGGETDGLPLASEVGRVDLPAAMSATANPHLAERRSATGLLAEADPGTRDALAGGVRPAALDWRDRFGRNWISTVRDQNPCGSCWAFAGTALVEAMLMIEHNYRARLSEGDLHDGIGLKCADGNNLGSVSKFLSVSGLADTGCWPYHTDNAPYAPTADRDGRSVRMPEFTWIGDLEQQKQWLDTTGPLATWFDVYHDFDGYRGGYVYRRSTDPANVERGGHFLLVVGYDDAQNTWICKNSWGPGWGDHGYVLVGYGEAGVDQYAKAALTSLSPDPWTKRRLHNGNLYESGNGALQRNLEVIGSTRGVVTHHWREGGPPFTWNVSGRFGSDAAVCPTIIGTTYNRNLETVHTTTGHRLHHWFRAGGGGIWTDGGVFGPADCHGAPGFVQSDYGAPGNFEVVVAVGGGRLQHVWREGAPNWTWHEGPRFGANVAVGGATLVQGDYHSGEHGNLEYVAVLDSGQLQHFWRNEADGSWNAGPVFGAGLSSSPVMVPGQYGMRDEAGPHGNFELCVAVDGAVQHWWRDNAGGSGEWRHSATFGRDMRAVTGLTEGSWGMNLELVVLRTDGRLQHYWRDGAGWHEGPIIGTA
jgi:Papain family cysteine protease